MKAQARRRIKIRDALFRVRHYAILTGNIGIVYGMSIYGEGDPMPEVVRSPSTGWQPMLRAIPKPNLLRKK